LADNETAYFLWSNFLGPWTRRGLIKSIGTYHGLLIVGKMQARLMKELLRDKMPPYWIIYNGVPEKKLEGSSTALANKKLRILLIAHGPSGWRTWYKGLDLWMETLEKLSYKLSGVEGWVVGQWQEEEIQRLLRLYPKAPVQFLGAMQDVTQVVKEANLYLHLGRGEAWGLAVLEAMAMGVPAIVSEYTGAAEVVEQVWTEGVVPLSADLAAEAVLRYFSLSEAERRALSEKGQTLIREKYRLSQAIETFQAAFSEALKVVGLR
jgi:glycosyltransferase involved in cell wall biosynthesis